MATRPLRFDPIAEAHRQWRNNWPDQAEHMAAITSIMRVQQLALAAVERVLRPHELTFASYEALRLLAFSRNGALPLGKMGERLQVHPASVTNTIDRLEARGLVTRESDPSDGRRKLAAITPAGRATVEAATTLLHDVDFGLGALGDAQARALTQLLRVVRVDAADFDPDAEDPWGSDLRGRS